MPKYSGKVVKVFSKALDKPDNYENTHRHSLELEDLGWVAFGSSKQDSFIVKDDNGKWKVLGAGSEVVFKYTENGQYKNAKKSDLVVMELVEGTKFEPQKPQQQGNTQAKPAQQNASSGSTGGFKRDDSAVIAGNSRTAAFTFLKGKPYKKINEVNSLVEQFALLADAKRKEYKAANPSLDDFQVGVSVGQSVVLAAGIAKTFEDVSSIVDEILEQVIPFSVQVVKDVASGKYNEPEPDDYEEPQQDAFEDDLDSLPF